jgi:hypothetical protein
MQAEKAILLQFRNPAARAARRAAGAAIAAALNRD